MVDAQLVIPIFPLNVVLFNGGWLPLHIFEPRYVNMVENAIESNTGFGVVLLKEGPDVHVEGSKELPGIHEVGTLASIHSHEKLPENRYSLLAEGGIKFRVASSWEQDDHLRMAQIQIEMVEPKLELRKSDQAIASLLRALRYHQEGQGIATASVDYEDATAVSLRMAENLPLELDLQQELLELNNAHMRLDVIAEWLREQSVYIDE